MNYEARHRSSHAVTPVHPLERRRLLASISWDGEGDGTSWSDPSNWSGDTAPQAGDSVDISYATSEVILTEDVSVNGLLVYSAGLTIDGATLTSAGSIGIDFGHIFVQSGGVLHSSGEVLTVDGGMKIGRIGDAIPSRLVLDGAFEDFNGEGGIGFNAGSVLDLTGVNAPSVSVQHQLAISSPIVEAPAGLRFSGGGNSQLYNWTTTGPLEFYSVSIGGTFNLGGDLTIRMYPEVRFSFVDDVTFKGDHVVNVVGDGQGNWIPFTGELNVNAEIRIAPETEMRVLANGEFFTDYSGASILNQGRLVFDASDVDADHDFRVKVDLINLGTIEVINGAHVTFENLIGNANEITTSGANTTLSLDGDYELNEMQIGEGTTLFLADSSWQYDMSINVNGTVIFDHDGNVARFNLIKSMVRNGFASGWTGGSLRDSLAATDTRYTLGYAASDVIVGVDGGVFGGLQVDSTAVIVHHTLDADFNFDGAVNFNDILKIAQNYNTSGRNFTDGDTDFNGAVNFNDLLRASQLYGQSLFSSQLISKSKQGDSTSARSVLTQ